MAYIIAEKAIRFQHPVYNLDRAQKLISLSMSRRLSTRNISSKSMHMLLSNLADRQMRAHAFTSSFVRGKITTLLCELCYECSTVILAVALSDFHLWCAVLLALQSTASFHSLWSSHLSSLEDMPTVSFCLLPSCRWVLFSGITTASCYFCLVGQY